MTITANSILKKTLLIFLFVGGIYYGKAFFMPLCFGGILAALFLPLSQWLESKKIHRAIAVIICLLFVLTIIGSFISLFGWKISELVSQAEQFKEKSIVVINNFQEYLFSQFGLTKADQMLILQQQQPSYGNIIQSMASSVSALLANLVLISLYFVFMLYYRGHIKKFMLLLSQESHRPEMEKIIHNTSKVSQQYLVGLSKIIVCLWFMYGIGFSLIGVKNAIFFAVLCGFLEVIPYLGNIFGTFITIFVSAIHGGDISLLVGIGIVYGTVQTIQGWLLEPLILGPQVKINPLFTIIVLILGQLLWGIPGVILAIPLTAMFKIVCDNVESLKPYGFFIGEIVEINPKESKVNKILKKLKKSLRIL